MAQTLASQAKEVSIQLCFHRRRVLHQRELALGQVESARRTYAFDRFRACSPNFVSWRITQGFLVRTARPDAGTIWAKIAKLSFDPLARPACFPRFFPYISGSISVTDHALQPFAAFRTVAD